MTEESIDLSGLTILVSDDEREELTGAFTASELADRFLSYWIPYLECQECCRHTYCKFTKPNPYPVPRSVGRLADIQCGAVKSVIDNYVRGVFSLLGTLSQEELQKFLDGSFHLIRFVYQAELHIGQMIDAEQIAWLGSDKYRAFFFGWTARLREDLDRFAGAFRSIESFSTKRTFILTEGASEKAFLERLRQSRFYRFPRLDVESYDGKGNRGSQNLRLLAQRLKKEGNELFIQGDCDGKNRDIFQELIRREIVEADNTFAFKVDFESSFPAQILYSALKHLGFLDGVDFDEFKARLDKRGSKPVLKFLSGEFQVVVDNKILLAESLAEVLNNANDVWSVDEFWQSEIGQFLDKIRRLS